MPLMVWLKDIYQGRDIEGDVTFTHPTLHYGFSLLLHWGLKYLLSGHQVQSMLQLWLLFFSQTWFGPQFKHAKGVDIFMGDI